MHKRQEMQVPSLGSGRSPGVTKGNPLQYSCLENPINSGAWWDSVHRVAKIQTRLSTHTYHTSKTSTVNCFRVSWLIGKDPDAGRDWGQEEKEMTEDEMVGWHHWLGGHEFEHALGVGDGQGSLVCCVQSMGSQSQSDMTERLNWTEYDFKFSSPPSLYSIFSQYCPICKIKTSSVNWFHSFFRAWANLIFRKKGFYPIPFMTFSQHLSL